MIPIWFRVKAGHFPRLDGSSLLFLIKNVSNYKVIIKKNKKNHIIRQKAGNNVMLRVNKKIISEKNSHEDLNLCNFRLPVLSVLPASRETGWYVRTTWGTSESWVESVFVSTPTFCPILGDFGRDLAKRQIDAKRRYGSSIFTRLLSVKSTRRNNCCNC